jgi:hypothetical protein
LSFDSRLQVPIAPRSLSATTGSPYLHLPSRRLPVTLLNLKPLLVPFNATSKLRFRQAFIDTLERFSNWGLFQVRKSA